MNGLRQIEVKKLTGIWEKMIGLIGKTDTTPIYFETRFGIHTFGMLKPIDVLILNDNFEVVKKATALKPNRVFFWNPIYKKIVEVPGKSAISEHEQLILQPIT